MLHVALKALIKILLFVVLASILIISVMFSWRRMASVRCEAMEVIIAPDSPRYLNEEDISGIVYGSSPGLMDTMLYTVDTRMIERILEETPSIKNAEVYRRFYIDGTSIRGKLVIEAGQREPLFRVLTADKDYYVDSEGVMIPSFSGYVARVLVVTGSVKEEVACNELLPMMAFIAGEEFWNAQIKQVYVDSSGELTLIPLAGDHIIEFGDPGNYREKFRNLKALYTQGLAKTGWDRYSKISLKYKNQVVCTKK